MFSLSSVADTAQKRRLLIILSLFHIFIITISNYLVQVPFEVTVPLMNFSFNTTWGTFTFPFIFLATDLTVRLFGAKEARWIVFVVMIPALIISYLVSTLFYERSFLGFGVLAEFNFFVFRIALASFTAYVFGQLLDVLVFNRLRQLKTWWIAPTCSTTFGSALDTLLFFFIAFYKSSDAFLAAHWFELGVVDYLFKLFVCLLFFIPAYGVVLNFLLKKLKGITA